MKNLFLMTALVAAMAFLFAGCDKFGGGINNCDSDDSVPIGEFKELYEKESAYIEQCLNLKIKGLSPI